ncbi:hypothetical protein [Enterobacter ludwigii]|uniref:hypothetical protein n=1 Tax=Enterobacter ludwigii TaxID=299767 RepID=UPI000A9FD970|nr:hypothetical protein [Enterobacter ludwigii]
MDYLKRTNKILLSLVIILFVFAIIAFAKVIFNSMSSLEWGSISDWVNTGSSIATTYIAYLAYKAAPNWFKQKTYEAGFDHVNNLLSEYDSIEENIQRFYWDVISIKPSNSRTSQTWREIETLAYRAISLKGNLFACQRFNVSVLPETFRCFERLRQFCDISYRLQGHLYMQDDEMILEAHKELGDLKDYIKYDSDNIKSNMHDYFILPK